MERPHASVFSSKDCTEEDDLRFHVDIETLYAIRRPDFIRSLVRFGVNVVEAEDVTQEVFLRILTGERSDIGGENLFGWLLTCARNLAINRFRKGRREDTAISERWSQWEQSLQDTARDPEAQTAETERHRRLAAAMTSLDPLEQQCLLLRTHGLTFRQMSETLSLPARQVIYTTDVAVQKLQKKLQVKR